MRYFINTTTTTTKIVSSKDETDSLSSLNNNRNTISIKNKLNNSKNQKKLNNRQLGESGSTEESDDEKLIIKADPIYHTIEPEKSKKALGRNCVSLENLGMLTTTYKNDLNGYGGQEYDMRWNKPMFSYQQPNEQSYYHYQYYQQQQQYLQQYYNQFQLQNTMQLPYYQSHISIPLDCNFNQLNQMNQINQINHMNQYNNHSAYFNQNAFHGSNANSRQSLGNVSDDFRKYRDVAL